MSLVRTLPELQVACLGGFLGMGYAEITSDAGNAREYRGVIVFDEDVDLIKLSSADPLFEGVVYRHGEEEFEAMSVEILMINQDLNQEPGATFIARHITV